MEDELCEGWSEIQTFLGWSDHKVKRYRNELKRLGVVFRVVERYGENLYPKPRVKAYKSRLMDFIEQKSRNGENL